MKKDLNYYLSLPYEIILRKLSDDEACQAGEQCGCRTGRVRPLVCDFYETCFVKMIAIKKAYNDF